jgi:hypothetical protein
MIARSDLHSILDAIPEDRLSDARSALEALADPVLLVFLTAPEDDEPLTLEDVAAIEEGKADIARGDVIPYADVERRLLG